MTEQDGGNPRKFIATKNSRRFGEMCDACRQARVVGLGYGPPGTGKTESAKQYAHLMRAPQLYSRVGFAHEMEPLSKEETHDLLGKRWSHRVKPHSDDFTDKEAVATIVRITRGNLRLIDRLMLQVEHVLLANKIQVVTKEVVETARQNLIIGPG